MHHVGTSYNIHEFMTRRARARGGGPAHARNTYTITTSTYTIMALGAWREYGEPYFWTCYGVEIAFKNRMNAYTT